MGEERRRAAPSCTQQARQNAQVGRLHCGAAIISLGSADAPAYPQASTRGKTATAAEPEAATPLACLFDRFDALAIGTTAPKATRPSALRLPAPGPMPPPVSSGPAGRVPAATPPRSPLGPARRVTTSAAPPTRQTGASASARVSFGLTPSVHEYNAVAGPPASSPPCSSHAGRTPYSLAASSQRGRSGSAWSGSRDTRGGHTIAGASPLGVPDFALAEVAEGEEDAASGGEEQAAGNGSVTGVEVAGASSSAAGHGFSGTSFAFATAAATHVTPARSARALGGSGDGDKTPVLLLGGGPVTTAAAAAAQAPDTAGDVRLQAQQLVAGSLPFAGALWRRASAL